MFKTSKGIAPIIIVIIVAILAIAGTGFGVYFWQYKKDQNEKQVLEQDKTNLQNQINELQNQIEELKNQLEAPLGNTQDAIRPTVSVISKIKRYEYPWRFQFSEEMDETTVIADNINLYAVGLSIGTLGDKNLANDILKGWKFSYDTKTKILTITVADREDLVCASCNWELEFTTKIKDKTGNSLIKKSFKDI